MGVDLMNIERTYWDYLCANLKVSEIDRKSVESYQSQLIGFPKLSDFRFFYSPKPLSAKDKRFWHVNSDASQDWRQEMTQNGLKVCSFGTILGTFNHSCSPSIAAPRDLSLADAVVALTPHVAVQHVASDIWRGCHIDSPNLGDISRIFFLMSSYLMSIGSDIRLAHQNMFDQFCAQTLKAEALEKAGEYRNFTLCPLIENIRRYEQQRGNDFFSCEMPTKTATEEEKTLWALAKYRDVYLAHNRHYPFLLGDKQHKYDFSVIQNGNVLNEEKVSHVLENKVMELVGAKNRTELYSHLAELKFEPITEIWADTNAGKIPVYQIIHYYISTTLFLYENVKALFGENQRSTDILKSNAELSETQLQQVKRRLIHFRCMALHDHVPIEEWKENPQRLTDDLALASQIMPLFIRGANNTLWRRNVSQRQERIHT